MAPEIKIPILLVDDGLAHRALIRRALRKAGIENPLVEAGSLREAELLLRANPSETPILAVLDLNLTDGRGTNLLKEMRAQDRFKNMPIIILSTSELSTDITESYGVGATCYVVKTEDPKVFSRDISSCVLFWLKQAGCAF